MGTGRHTGGLQKLPFLRKPIKKLWRSVLHLAFRTVVVMGRSKWNWKLILLWQLRDKRCIIKLIFYGSIYKQIYMWKSRDLLECVCVCKNISPEQELFSKGQVKGRLRNKTDFSKSLPTPFIHVSFAKNSCCFKKTDISEPHTTSVLVNLRATALPSLPRGRNTCRRYSLIGIKTEVENQNLSASSAVPSSSSATCHFCKVFSQYNNHVNLSIPAS